MRLATIAAATMAFLAAAACKPVPASEPAPDRERADPESLLSELRL